MTRTIVLLASIVTLQLALGAKASAGNNNQDQDLRMVAESLCIASCNDPQECRKAIESGDAMGVMWLTQAKAFLGPGR